MRPTLTSQLKIASPSTSILDLPHFIFVESTYHLLIYYVISLFIVLVFLFPVECKLYEDMDYLFCLLTYS